MGVDYNHCKACNDCVYSDYFPQCFSCYENDDICERCFDRKNTNAILFKDDYFYLCTYCLKKYSNDMLIEYFYHYTKCKIKKNNVEKQLIKLKSKIPTEEEELNIKLKDINNQLSILESKKNKILTKLHNKKPEPNTFTEEN